MKRRGIGFVIVFLAAVFFSIAIRITTAQAAEKLVAECVSFYYSRVDRLELIKPELMGRSFYQVRYSSVDQQGKPIREVMLVTASGYAPENQRAAGDPMYWVNRWWFSAKSPTGEIQFSIGSELDQYDPVGLPYHGMVRYSRTPVVPTPTPGSPLPVIPTAPSTPDLKEAGCRVLDVGAMPH